MSPGFYVVGRSLAAPASCIALPVRPVLRGSTSAMPTEFNHFNSRFESRFFYQSIEHSEYWIRVFTH